MAHTYYMTFEQLELIEPIRKALKKEKYTTPTPIQAEAIPLVLDGSDLLGCAQTGTGKTAAFSIPIIQKIEEQISSRRKPGIKALVLTPTRELAIQIGESFTAYGCYTHVKHTVIFGGVGQKPQTDALERGVDVLIATPGRLLDLPVRVLSVWIHWNILFWTKRTGCWIWDLSTISNVSCLCCPRSASLCSSLQQCHRKSSVWPERSSMNLRK